MFVPPSHIGFPFALITFFLSTFVGAAVFALFFPCVSV